jgi:hypothetical protein
MDNVEQGWLGLLFTRVSLQLMSRDFTHAAQARAETTQAKASLMVVKQGIPSQSQ